MPLVHAALGTDAVLTHFGCMLSFPGSATQPCEIPRDDPR